MGIDRRIKRTKNVLVKSLAELMKKESVGKITVKQLTELASVNRGTFYIHYNNIYELLSEVEQELLQGVEEILNRYPDESDFKKVRKQFLTDIFGYLREHADIVSVLISANGDLAFVNTLERTIWEHCKRMDKFFFTFVFDGCFGIFRQWIDSGQKQTPEELAGMVLSMIQD